MSKYIDAEKLIAEIERRKNDNLVSAKKCPTGYFSLVANEDIEILDFITSFQQERGPHTESWIETAKKELQHEEELLDMRLDALRRIREKKNQLKQEQTEVDLEKEIKDYFMGSSYNLSSYECWTIAKHFYELGLNARKEE